MKQVVSVQGKSRPILQELAVPHVRDNTILVANVCSILSPGTERINIDLNSRSVLQKAWDKPDRLNRILGRIRREGIGALLKQATSAPEKVMSPIGYSSAGIVIAVGKGVEGFRPGDRVASNGPHAEFFTVPKNLASLIPPDVSFEDAAFATLGAIALQGVRLSKVSLGERVLVVGLGVVGQLTASLLRAQGVKVFGLDLDARRVELAKARGVYAASTESKLAREASGKHGYDAVLVTASSESSAPMHCALDAVRKKGRVVVVGAVKMDLPREKIYEKETEIVVSCSYGPGRYDPDYEQSGNDYPLAFVRWTENRNMEAVLELINDESLPVGDLLSHRFRLNEVDTAYSTLLDSPDSLAIALQYCDQSEPSVTSNDGTVDEARLAQPSSSAKIGISVIGGGAFAESMLLPNIHGDKRITLRHLISSNSLGSSRLAERFDLLSVSGDVTKVEVDQDTKGVFVLTRHNQHASQVASLLAAGKAAYVEKPLCLSLSELKTVSAVVDSLDSRPFVLFVGFNRRFAPLAIRLKEFFDDVSEPLTTTYRFNAGQLPATHWTHDKEIGGGRIIGEACHAIDFVTFLTSSLPSRVFADCIGGTNSPPQCSDQAFITMRHLDGSLSSIAYLAGGSREMPKERIEVIGGGRSAVLDDFRSLTLFDESGETVVSSEGQDKGHASAFSEFLDCLAGTKLSPFDWDETRTVAAASILAEESLRIGVPLEVLTSSGH